MAKISLKLNEPLDGALLHHSGRHYPSKFAGRDGSFMYGLASGDAIFIEEEHCQNPDLMFKERGIRVGVPFRICLRKSQSGAKYYEVVNLGDSPQRVAAPAPEKSPLEEKLQASITQIENQKTQRANPSTDKPAAPSTASTPNQGANEAPSQSYVSALDTVRQSSLSQFMGGCIVAAIDGIVAGTEYAKSRGITLHFTEASIQDLSTTLMIHVQRLAELECRYGVVVQSSLSRQRAYQQQPQGTGGGAPWRQ